MRKVSEVDLVEVSFYKGSRSYLSMIIPQGSLRKDTGMGMLMDQC